MTGKGCGLKSFRVFLSHLESSGETDLAPETVSAADTAAPHALRGGSNQGLDIEPSLGWQRRIHPSASADRTSSWKGYDLPQGATVLGLYGGAPCPVRWLKSMPGIDPFLGWQRRIHLSARANQIFSSQGFELAHGSTVLGLYGCAPCPSGWGVHV